MKRHVFLITALVVGLLLVSGNAWAKKPDKDEQYLFSGKADYTYATCTDVITPDFTFGVPYQCDNGMLLCELGMMHIDTKLFYDRDGNPIRYTERSSGMGMFYEFGSGGENRLEAEPWHYTFFAELGEDGEILTGDEIYSYRGLAYKVKVPGHGVIFMDTGLVIVNANFEVTFQAGRHDYYDGNLEIICDYLGGE